MQIQDLGTGRPTAGGGLPLRQPMWSRDGRRLEESSIGGPVREELAQARVAHRAHERVRVVDGALVRAAAPAATRRA